MRFIYLSQSFTRHLNKATLRKYLECFQVVSNFLENNLISSCFDHGIKDKAEIEYKHIPSHVVKWNVDWTTDNFVIQEVTTGIKQMNDINSLTSSQANKFIKGIYSE